MIVGHGATCDCNRHSLAITVTDRGHRLHKQDCELVGEIFHLLCSCMCGLKCRVAIVRAGFTRDNGRSAITSAVGTGTDSSRVYSS